MAKQSPKVVRATQINLEECPVCGFVILLDDRIVFEQVMIPDITLYTLHSCCWHTRHNGAPMWFRERTLREEPGALSLRMRAERERREGDRYGNKRDCH